MVFGELLGGLATRAGERFNENTQRKRAMEDWQRAQRLGMWTDFMRQNWDNLQADQQEAVINQMAPDLGIKPKDAMGMVTAARGIHGIIPQIQAVPESLGKPRAEIGQLPQPADVLTPSIMAPSTGGVARAPSMTPNEVFAQRKFEYDNAVRRQRLAEIGIAPLPPHLREAAVAKEYGVNAIPVLTSEIGADARVAAADTAAAARGKRQFFRIPGSTPETSTVVNYIERGGKLYDDAGNQVSLPPNTVTLREGYSVSTDDQGNLHIVNQQAAVGPGNYQAVLPGAGRVTQPRAQPVNRASAERSRDFRDKMALRKDFETHPITKQADETARQVKMAESALAQGSTNFVAIDQALINVLNKMIDPNSVVREGEYARTIDNTPLLNRIKGKMAAIQSGGAGLTAEERQALLAISKRFAADSQAAYNIRATEFKRMAAENGWNPNDIVVPRSPGGAAASPADSKQQLIEFLKQKQQQLGGR